MAWAGLGQVVRSGWILNRVASGLSVEGVCKRKRGAKNIFRDCGQNNWKNGAAAISEMRKAETGTTNLNL